MDQELVQEMTGGLLLSLQRHVNLSAILGEETPAFTAESKGVFFLNITNTFSFNKNITLL